MVYEQKRWKIYMEFYKGKRCVLCKSAKGTQYHHKHPLKKSFNIWSKGHSNTISRIRREVKKCIIVCDRCHDKIHEKLSWTIKMFVINAIKRYIIRPVKRYRNKCMGKISISVMIGICRIKIALS